MGNSGIFSFSQNFTFHHFFFFALILFFSFGCNFEGVRIIEEGARSGHLVAMRYLTAGIAIMNARSFLSSLLLNSLQVILFFFSGIASINQLQQQFNFGKFSFFLFTELNRSWSFRSSRGSSPWYKKGQFFVYFFRFLF